MIKDQFKDPLIKILLLAAILTMIGSGFEYKSVLWGFVEGFSIIIATLFLVSIAAANDFNKDRQFLKLLDMVKDEKVAVLRGKVGLT